MSQAQQHAEFSGTPSGGQAVIAAPSSQNGVNAKTVVLGMVITAEAAGKVTVSFSASNQKIFEFAAAGSYPVGAMRWEGDAGAALTVTSSIAVDVSFDYVTEGA